MSETLQTEKPGMLTTRPWYKWYALAVLVLVYISSHVDRQIMGILVEPIKAELGATDSQMGLLMGLTFALFYATLGMPIAMLADRGNRRNIITAAVTIWSAMTVACGYAQSFVQLTIARIGVGVGEAGSSPPSHSMISDMFPLKQRGTAMGIYALGVNFGLLLAYLTGGWMSEHWGWRTTFIAVGLPGLLLAVLVRFTVEEPVRGAQDDKSRPQAKAPSFLTVAKYIWNTPAARHVIFGSSLAGFVGYGMTLWLPAFFMRSHGLTPTEMGFTLAMMSGVVGGAGTFMAGKLADMLASRDERWFAWVVAIGKAGLVPFLVWFFLTMDFKSALAIYLIPAFFGGFYLAPTFAMVQSLVKPEMRAVAASICLFLLNIIGLGIGPWGVGVLSDYLEPEFGKESLRYALMLFSLINVWCGFHYYLGGRTLREGIAKVAED
ncbi:MAG: MFS transporter [Pseudomonadales bacterium]|nr:MFS transporter [Pseudomonadales bacterium]